MPGLGDDPFNPNNPATQVLLLAQRVDTLCREKEELERTAVKLTERLSRFETLFSNEKIEKIDNAIQFMSNSEFMAKWTWKFIMGTIVLSGSFYGAFKFWKGS